MWAYQRPRSPKLHNKDKDLCLPASGDASCMSSCERARGLRRGLCVHCRFLENVWKLTASGVPPQAFVPAVQHVKCRKWAQRKDWEGVGGGGVGGARKKTKQTTEQPAACEGSSGTRSRRTASHYLLFRRAVAVAFSSQGKLAHIDRKRLTTLARSLGFFSPPLRPRPHSLHLR